jgi:predicted HTH transcriptional regulator
MSANVGSLIRLLGGRCEAAEIAAHFQVSEKTAQRDLTDLKAKQLIEFVGASKTGVYRVKGPSP